MAQDAGYSILTHYISVDVFISMIESDIKKLIRKFGHINCGLRHEELCEELKKYINQKKTPILSLMNEEGKKEWNTKWSRKRSEFFNRLFEEEGFINMCYPKKYTDEPKLYQFKSKHIQFCQERDVWKEDVEKNNEYNECVRYNMWINTETASLTREFLSNVRVSSLPTVKKYFSTKTQPKGYEPPDIYRKSKLDCEIYNPASKRYQQKSVTKASPNNPHTSTSPDVRQESHGKGGISMPDEGKIEITKSHVKELPKSESPDSLTSSITKTEVDDTASGKQPSTDPENTSIKSTSSHDTTNDQQNNYKVILQGSPVVDSVPIFQPIPDSHPNPDDEYLKLQSFFYSHLNNLDGQKITQDMHERIYTKPVMFPKTYPTYIHSNPMVSILTKGYNNILPKNTRAKHHPPVYTHVLPFQKANSTASQFTQNRKPWKTGSSFFHQELPPFYSTIKASRNKKMDVVEIELPTPDPSLFRSPVMIYTLVLLVLFTITTMLFLLSKYTTFGLLFGKNKKKKRLKRQLQITKLEKEVSHFNTMDNYSTNHTPYENKKGNEKNIYNQIKMQKGIIHKNIILPKRKKRNRKAIIDIHMELLNECKNDEWEFNKDDFLQICLEQFIKEQNKIYSNSKNSNLITKSLSTQNAKEAKMLLWDKWAEKYTPIWNNFKKGNTFKLLQYYWKEEENTHFHKIEKENSSLNQNDKCSYIQIKKDIWKRWTTKQAKLIEQYKEEQWFKSLVEELENVSDEYKKGKIKDDIFVANIKELENKENNEELYKRVKHIFLIKVLIQILMMIIEECIKEESCGKTEKVLDNLIEKLNKEKHEKIESENIHQENMNHKEYNEMLEQKKPKNQDNFKELIEGQKAKMIYK